MLNVLGSQIESRRIARWVRRGLAGVALVGASLFGASCHHETAGRGDATSAETLDGISSAAPALPSHLEAIARRKKLVVSCFPQQISRFVSVNLDRGPMKRIGTGDDFSGFDIEIMRLLAEDLGVALEIRPVSEPSYTQVVALLTAARADVVASGLTITPERTKRADFSKPYVEYVDVVVARRDQAPRTLDDLRQSRVAVSEGSSSDQMLMASGFPESQIERVAFMTETYSLVSDGTVDFTIVESIQLETVLAEYPRLAPRFRVGDAKGYGFAVPAGSDLDLRIDALLDRLRATGRYQTLVEETFGVSTDLSRLDHLPVFSEADLAS